MVFSLYPNATAIAMANPAVGNVAIVVVFLFTPSTKSVAVPLKESFKVPISPTSVPVELYVVLTPLKLQYLLRFYQPSFLPSINNHKHIFESKTNP